MRYLLLALLLLGAAVMLAYPERERQAFTPLVRVRSADGLYITVVHPAVARRAECAHRLARFEAELRSTCSACTVESSDCARELAGIDRSLAGGESLPIFAVHAGALRAGVLGPPRFVQAACEAMASELAKSGLKAATCVAPPAR